MFSSLKTSEANKIRITELTSKLSLGAENAIARIALGHSLAQSKKLDLKNIADAKGKEYSKRILLGEHEAYYIALICQKYGLYKTDKDIPKYLKLHIDHGLELVHGSISSNPNLDGIDFLISEVSLGLG
ncbi:DndE family protein [Microscilla marina]|uniref:DNA sulfur modification protein DndE n=1 Tax=Microscilla marina ATCC 23134 TaxID=313606 RepID=A1ZIK0_MICM2|nr:DndE family protein [Microscilla marina]EAY29868.1 conserved protein of unknown function, putative [Microscilla marina ATCC 23134]